MSRIIAQISEEDAEKMLSIFEKKMAIENLLKTKQAEEYLENERLFERFLKEYGKSVNDFQNMWNYLAEKYELISEEGKTWKIDFENKYISLE